MKRRRALLFCITFVLALCAACGWWLYQNRRQYALDRQLIEALLRNDTKTALDLVNAGANPNTCVDPPPPPSFQHLHEQWLHDEPLFDQINASPTAFLIACGSEQSSVGAGGFHPGILDENLPLLEAMFAHGADINV